jgi:Replication-relaxation
MLDQLNRRSRWSRAGTKAIRLSPRDLVIFELLLRYRYLRSDFIHAFIGGDRTKLIQRLNALYREPNCYLARPHQQRNYFNANYRSLIYELDQNGERALREYGCYDPAQAVAWLRRGRESHVTFAHSVMICDALASIELGIRNNPELRIVPWSEIVARMPDDVRNSKLSHCLPVNISHAFGKERHQSKKALMPDAVFGIEWRGKGSRYFALECDRDHEPLYRSNLNQTSYLRKVLQYQDVARSRTFKTHWGLPNLLVLNVTTSELHKHKIKDLVLELTEGKGASYLLFKTMPSLGDFATAPATGHLLSEPWERAGRDPFRLDQP